MNALDWMVVAVYLCGMIAMSAHLGRKQKDGRDYYVGGNDISHFAIAISTMATQCSTNSLLGAPAFVIAVGGLLWLQYELAVPLAMIGTMAFLLPFFRRQNLVSVYEYLEKRFGVGTRTLLSVLFQCLRAFSTGVTVYGISVVVQMLLGIPFWLAVLILGIVTLIYDFLGGIRAVVYSDVIQMIILYGGISVCLFYAIELCGGWREMWNVFPVDKAKTLDFSGHGFGDGKTFSFWPMLIGGFFLYLSYYGCDQTQVQRELSTRSVDDTNTSLFMNGILRFPLVITYCLVGVALAAFLVKNPSFRDLILDQTGEVNYNLAVPTFCINYLPHGVIGMIIVALFAAAMSSLDSTINSLSAVTLRDIIERFRVSGKLNDVQQLRWSRLLTVFWGFVCIVFSFFVGDISESVIESVNKLSSLMNGPILGAFLLAILTRKANDKGTFVGVLTGFFVNLYLWIAHPEISWLWWNFIGCAVTFGIGYSASLTIGVKFAPAHIDDLVYHKDAAKFFGYQKNWSTYYSILAGYFVVMVVLLRLIGK